MRPLFADPKTDFVFKRLFGKEEHKPLLIALLNGLLELDEAHQVVEVELLLPEQRPPVQELKHSIVDVKCKDARGVHYVVEMQVLNVEGFEKRVVYNVAKAYIGPLEAGQQSPGPNDVIGVTVCDFELWPRSQGQGVPMLSRWRMQEQHEGARGLGQVQFVFLELPKYDDTRPPQSAVEKWAYFFREVGKLKAVPEVLAERPYSEALEAARVARFTVEEWDAYIHTCIAIQDKRGALALARKEGLQEWEQRGKQKALRWAIRRTLHKHGLALSPQEEARLESCQDVKTLERWHDQALSASSASEALRDDTSV